MGRYGIGYEVIKVKVRSSGANSYILKSYKLVVQENLSSRKNENGYI